MMPDMRPLEAIRVPALGVAMTEALLLRWIKTTDEEVLAGEAVAEIETDKLVTELVSPATGRLVDLRSLFPLDMSTILGSADRTRHVVVVSEAPRHGGLTSEIAATVQEELFDVLARPVLRVGARHAPIPHSPALIAAAIPSEADLERAVRWSLHGKVDES